MSLCELLFVFGFNADVMLGLGSRGEVVDLEKCFNFISPNRNKICSNTTKTNTSNNLGHDLPYNRQKILK